MAKWKPFDLTWGRSIYYCTECKEGIEVPTSCGKPMYKFCPMCGARMDTADTPQTESTGSPIGDYRDGVGAWQTEPVGVKGWSSCTYCERYFSCDYLSGRRTDCGWGEPK